MLLCCHRALLSFLYAHTLTPHTQVYIKLGANDQARQLLGDVTRKEATDAESRRAVEEAQRLLDSI